MRRSIPITAGITGSCLALWAALPMLGTAAPTKAELDAKISKTQGKVQAKRSKEKVLTRDIQKYSTRIDSLESRIDKLGDRQSVLEEDLDKKRKALTETQEALRDERARLVRLQRRYKEAQGLLETRLVQQYKEGRTDLASVVIESDGFEQMIERGEYLSRLAAADQKVIEAVTKAKKEAAGTEKRLDRLEAKQQKIADAITERRDEVARIKGNVVSTQSTVKSARYEKNQALRTVKVERKHLESDLAKMEEASARIGGQLRTNIPAGPIRGGTGRFVYPMNGTFTSPFGARWGRLHAGIDIAGPVGTPIRAADGGRVALAGSVSGYGNYTCIQHSGSLSTCYAHQSSIGVRVGQQVRKGQVIGLCGNTGNSTGPHLHFEVRINGNPVNPMGYL